MRSRYLSWALLFLAMALAPPPALANQGDIFGFGRRTATAGAGTLWGDHPWGAFDSAASLGLEEYDQLGLTLQVGTLQLRPSGWLAADTDIDGLINPEVREDGTVVDALADDTGPLVYRPPHAIQIGFVKTLGPWLRMGVALSSPLQRLAHLRQNDPYFPYYSRWRTRPQRFSAYAGLSVRPVPGLYLGGGISVLAGARVIMDFDLDVELAEGKEGAEVEFVVNPATIDVELRLIAAPTASFLIDFELFDERLRGLRIGASWRGATQVRIDPTYLGVDLRVGSEIEDLELLVGVLRADVFFSVIDWYTPHTVTGSVAWDRGPLALAADLTWSAWSQMQPSVARVDETQTRVQLAIADLSPGASNARVLPEGMFRDTWSLRVGGTLRPPPQPLAGRMRRIGLALRAGYAFEPTYVANQTARTSILDNDIHTIGLGFGLETFDPFGWLDGPISIDLGAQLKLLAARTHERETPEAADNLPPGYPLGDEPAFTDSSGLLATGGHVFVGNITASIRY